MLLRLKDILHLNPVFYFGRWSNLKVLSSTGVFVLMEQHYLRMKRKMCTLITLIAIVKGLDIKQR